MIDSVILQNADCADTLNRRQLDDQAYFRSLEQHGISSRDNASLPSQMRAHLDTMVAALPDRLAVFASGCSSFPEGLGLKILAASKVSEGAWDLRIEGRDPDYGRREAQFRLQWSGEYAGGYHLFVLSSPHAHGMIPSVVHEDTVARELAIYTIGRQIAGTPLHR